MYRSTLDDIGTLIDRQRAAGASLALRSLATMVGTIEHGLATVQAAAIDGIRRRLGSVVVDLETLARRIEEGV